VELVSDRLRKMMPECAFGELGTCCVMCYMGPCRIDPFGQGPGWASAGDSRRHRGAEFPPGGDGRRLLPRRPREELAILLLEIAEGRAPGYRIREEGKLLALAGKLACRSTDAPSTRWPPTWRGRRSRTSGGRTASR